MFENMTECLGPCNPKQLVNILSPITDISSIRIYNKCGEAYDTANLEYAYSLDSVCWSCYMSCEDVMANTIGLGSDFYVRIKVPGYVSKIELCGEQTYDYRTSIAEGFQFGQTCGTNNTNLYNPYINLDGAVSLQQQLVEGIACQFGIPIYYIKLSGNPGSKDFTFKEYTLKNVEAVKQIKLIIMDNQMPSSKPEFAEWGIDFQTDWETEISKGMFATAFGNTAQPMEGDLIYIPMMKRMWMVSSAYEEKKDSLMWVSTTFKVALVKYQEKGSVDLGDTQEMVDALVKNTYEDIFGDNENIESGVDAAIPIPSIANNLTPVFEQDALRRYASIDSIDFLQGIYYHKGTMIADSVYTFSTAVKSAVIYQKQYCGEDGVISFIITPNNSFFENTIFSIGNVSIKINQTGITSTLSVVGHDKLSVTLNALTTYFVYLRWNRMMNFATLSVAEYKHKEVPLYMLQNQHYYFDIDNAKTITIKYDIEFVQEKPQPIILSSFDGKITNIKLFDIDNDNVSEILQMYPTHQHLILNDTARKLTSLNGV